MRLNPAQALERIQDVSDKQFEYITIADLDKELFPRFGRFLESSLKVLFRTQTRKRCQFQRPLKLLDGGLSVT
jgi:hypothetical protein